VYPVGEHLESTKAPGNPTILDQKIQEKNR
jgi:hypothetical protein